MTWPQRSSRSIVSRYNGRFDRMVKIREALRRGRIPFRWLVLGPAFMVAFGFQAGCAGNGAAPTPPSPPGTISTNPNSHVHLLQIAANSSLLLGDQEGLWQGNSQGSGWKPTGPPLNHMMVTCLARTAGVMLACTTTFSTKFFGTPKGLWRSTDRGKTWRRTSLPDLDAILVASTPPLPGTAVVFARPDGQTGVGHGGIWITRDSGRTWRRINSSLANDIPNGLVILPGRPFTVLFASTTAIYRSVDRGRTWTSNDLNGNPVLALAASPVRPRTAFAGALNGVWKTTDAGRHWSLHWPGPPTSPLAPAYDTVDDVYGYANAVKSYIYRMRDGTRGVLRGATPSSAGQLILEVDPGHPSHLYAAWSFPLRVYESTDSGRSWKKIL